MRAKVVGDVDMDIVVLADGTVGAARVTRSIHRELDHVALIAAGYWLFEPARLNGQAVAAQAVLTLSFRLH
jgi:TonB family protein